MTLRLVLAAVISATFILASSAQPTDFKLILGLHVGDRLVKRSDLVDRILWVLPQSRLANFAAQGMVINEEIRTSTIATGTVVASSSHIATISGTIVTIVRDVPRKRITTSHTPGSSRVAPSDIEIGVNAYALEAAAMIGLPASAVHIGSRWTTRQHVLTTLGSGTATFEHVVAAIENGRIRVDVTGTGTITGKEYNLPRLLPGTIRLTGSAWFDPASGLFAQESYRIENSLIKPAGAGRIGFIERMDAESSLIKEGRAPP